MSEIDGLLRRNSSKQMLGAADSSSGEASDGTGLHSNNSSGKLASKPPGKCTHFHLTIPVCHDKVVGEFVIGPDYQGIIASLTIIVLILLLSVRLISVTGLFGNIIKACELVALTSLVISVFYYYTQCALRDPGFLLSDYDFPPEAKLGYLCNECGLQKSRDYSHCFECGCCVHLRENHCAWVGKCIGSKTSGAFKRLGVCFTVLMCYVGALFGMYSISRS